MIASFQQYAVIAQTIAKQSIQPNAASAMALEKNTKKHRMLGMKGRSANGLQIAEGGAFYHQCLIEKLNLI